MTPPDQPERKEKCCTGAPNCKHSLIDRPADAPKAMGEGMQPMGPIDPDLMEALAAIEHDRWSDWMKHQFSKCIVPGAGDVVIPFEWAQRWSDQMHAPYEALTEREKESDRREVRRYLLIIFDWLSEKGWAAPEEREALQKILDMLHGVKFSDRCYYALKSRAETAEKELSNKEGALDRLRHAFVLVDVKRAEAERELSALSQERDDYHKKACDLAGYRDRLIDERDALRKELSALKEERRVLSEILADVVGGLKRIALEGRDAKALKMCEEADKIIKAYTEKIATPSPKRGRDEVKEKAENLAAAVNLVLNTHYDERQSMWRVLKDSLKMFVAEAKAEGAQK